MTWTHDKPKESGLYWMRSALRVGGYSDAQIVEYNAGRSMLFEIGKQWSFTIADCYQFYSEPIKPPESETGPDYKALLILYMAHVIECEGISFLENGEMVAKCSERVYQQLKEIEPFAGAMVLVPDQTWHDDYKDSPED